MDNEAEWIAALKRAALADAVRIEFGRKTSAADNSTSYSMNSYDEDDEVIGDDRDYDLLKGVFVPLERLSDGVDGDFLLSLDLKTETLKSLS